jgi:hypothetical protein
MICVTRMIDSNARQARDLLCVSLPPLKAGPSISIWALMHVLAYGGLQNSGAMM